MTQAVLIGAVIGLLYGVWEVLLREHFVAFRLSIDPNWKQLLADYGCATDKEAWERFQRLSERDGPNRIVFTILKRDLIFYNGNSFSRLACSWTIDEGSDTAPDEKQLHLAPGKRGYDLSLSTLETRREWPNEKRIQLAMIPYSEFYRYQSGLISRLLRRLLAFEKRKRRNEGWTLVRQEFPLDRRLLEHKYFYVSHEAI